MRPGYGVRGLDSYRQSLPGQFHCVSLWRSAPISLASKSLSQLLGLPSSLVSNPQGSPRASHVPISPPGGSRSIPHKATDGHPHRDDTKCATDGAGLRGSLPGQVRSTCVYVVCSQCTKHCRWWPSTALPFLFSVDRWKREGGSEINSHRLGRLGAGVLSQSHWPPPRCRDLGDQPHSSR